MRFSDTVAGLKPLLTLPPTVTSLSFLLKSQITLICLLVRLLTETTVTSERWGAIRHVNILPVWHVFVSTTAYHWHVKGISHLYPDAFSYLCGALTSRLLQEARCELSGQGWYGWGLDLSWPVSGYPVVLLSETTDSADSGDLLFLVSVIITSKSSILQQKLYCISLNVAIMPKQCLRLNSGLFHFSHGCHDKPHTLAVIFKINLNCCC